MPAAPPDVRLRLESDVVIVDIVGPLVNDVGLSRLRDAVRTATDLARSAVVVDLTGVSAVSASVGQTLATARSEAFRFGVAVTVGGASEVARAGLGAGTASVPEEGRGPGVLTRPVA